MANVAARRNLASLFTRTLVSSSSSSLSSRSRFIFPLIDKNPLSQFIPDSVKIPIRFESSDSDYSPLDDPSPNWSNRPPKETSLLDDLDYEHWLIIMEFPTDPKPTEDEMINAYVKTLASVVGSEEEAKKKIYSVSTRTYTGFGALISEELSHELKVLPGVVWVFPDSYLDIPNKDYGGDLFVDGKVIHRPQFWYNNDNNRANSKNSSCPPRFDIPWEKLHGEGREPVQGQPVQQPPPPTTEYQNSDEESTWKSILNQELVSTINLDEGEAKRKY